MCQRASQMAVEAFVEERISKRIVEQIVDVLVLQSLGRDRQGGAFQTTGTNLEEDLRTDCGSHHATRCRADFQVPEISSQDRIWAARSGTRSAFECWQETDSEGYGSAPGRWQVSESEGCVSASGRWQETEFERCVSVEYKVLHGRH